MSIFQPKPSIQLSADQEEDNSAPQRSPAFSRKSSSSWSIPCCNHISLGKSGGRIQLPDDSDNDSADEEYNQPSPYPFNTAYNEDNHSQNLPNVFSQAQARSQTSLSRNPFARVDEERQSKAIDREVTPQTEHQIDSFIPEVKIQRELQIWLPTSLIQASGEEELASFTRSPFTRYDDEPDWTEAYKNDGDGDIKDVEPTIKGFQIQNEEAEIEDDGNSEISTDALNTQANHIAEPGVIPTEQINDTSASLTRSADEEEDVQTEKEDKIPQIEKEVLHLLPLPELSNEIPPAMIHKKASFEKSMYGEQPLMSVTRNQGSRVSRFSMTEEDYLALKKAEHQEKKVSSSLNMKGTENPTMSAQNENKTTVQENPLIVADTKPQEEATKDDRRSSIAQSILGDKLDDFTEKLAFIKKNIIMSIDSDEEDDEEISAENILKRMEQVKYTRYVIQPYISSLID